jgi:hypothetical protein
VYLNLRLGYLGDGNYMTKKQEREVIRVCGENYNRWDIPPAMRNNIENEVYFDKKKKQIVGKVYQVESKTLEYFRNLIIYGK